MLLNCNIQWYERISPAGWVVLPLILAAIIWALYDLNRRNKRFFEEDQKEYEQRKEKEKQKRDAARLKYELTVMKPKSRTGMGAVQLSLL